MCLQEELIKVRLNEAENEETIRKLNRKISEIEEVKLHFLIHPYVNIDFSILTLLICIEGIQYL